jgi:hypothetical protein
VTPVDDLQEKLAGMQEAFEGAPVDSGYGGPQPPDGKYQALVQGFDFFESKKGELFLKTELQVQLHPEWEGHVGEAVHSVDDPERIGYLKTHLARMGLEVDELDFSTLQGRLEELLDVPVGITVKRSKNGKYVNYYVDERLGNPMPGARGKAETDAPAEAPETDTRPARSDDDIPF